MRLRPSLVLTFAVAATALSGCLTLSPRFSQEVAADFAHAPMRKLRTPHVTLYYPEQRREKALRLAAALERCTTSLRAHLVEGPQQPPLVAYLTDARFNNAYVQPVSPGLEQQMVLTDTLNLELFNWFNLGLSRINDVSCHEAVHAVQLADIHGFWKGINLVTGGVLSPQVYSQSWFLEGLATHYEGRLISHGGRPSSPVWNQLFESGVASQGGEIGTSLLSPEDRDGLPYGAHYLVGMHFIDYLASRYGEEKLWELINRQGSSFFSPFAVTLRFDGVYDKTIGGLLEDYEKHLKRTLSVRTRPATQRVVEPDAGYVARLAASPADGALAMLTARRDDVIRLVVRERDGAVRFERALTQVLPFRSWVVASPSAVSGLSFTGDGKSLFLLIDDVTSRGDFDGRLVELDARTGALLNRWSDVPGLGGGVSPDGSHFSYVDLSSGSSALAWMDLRTGAKEVLATFPGDASLGSPVVAPDGKRIAFAQWSADGFNLFLREADGSIRALTQDGKSNYGPRWIDAGHLLFTREWEGRLQAHRLDLDTGRVERLTEAPYLALDAAPRGPDEVVFLNREAWSWTVDAAPAHALQALESRAAGEITAVRMAGSAPVSAPASPSGNSPLPLTGPSASPTGDPRVSEWAAGPVPGEGVTSPATTEGVPPGPAAADANAASAADPGLPRVLRFPDAPVSEAPKLESDERYSPLEGFFIPRFRLPFIALLGASGGTGAPVKLDVYLTGSASGVDRLGMHAWALTGSYRTLSGDNSESFAYGNYQLAPWYTSLALSRTHADGITDVSASLTTQRTFWTSPVGFGFEALQERRPESLTRLMGPSVTASYSAADGSPYGGPRRGIALSLSAAGYPRAFGSSFDLVDVAGGARVYIPLPVSRRHSFNLAVRGRAVLGGPEQFLRVGGESGGTGIALPNRPGDAEPTLALPGGLHFAEALRGYEDHAIEAASVVVGSATYRYPFIIDHGWSSVLWIFPPVFLRQVDLELYGVAARLDRSRLMWMRSAGAALFLRTTWMDSVPLSLYYQFAYRFDDALPPLHTVGISLQ